MLSNGINEKNLQIRFKTRSYTGWYIRVTTLTTRERASILDSIHLAFPTPVIRLCVEEIRIHNSVFLPRSYLRFSFFFLQSNTCNSAHCYPFVYIGWIERQCHESIFSLKFLARNSYFVISACFLPHQKDQYTMTVVFLWTWPRKPTSKNNCQNPSTRVILVTSKSTFFLREVEIEMQICENWSRRPLYFFFLQFSSYINKLQVNYLL